MLALKTLVCSSSTFAGSESPRFMLYNSSEDFYPFIYKCPLLSLSARRCHGGVSALLDLPLRSNYLQTPQFALSSILTAHMPIEIS